MDLADEFFHEPTDEEYWSESHYPDAVDVDAGVAFHTRIGFYPNRNTANVFAYLTVDEDIYWLREESVAPSDTHGLVAETDGWKFRMLPVEPPHKWNVAVEGEAKTASTDDTEAVLEGRGESTEMEVELTAKSRHDPFYYSDGETFPLSDDADRYEVATRVEGMVKVEGGDDGRDFEGVGERDHSWGRRKWAGDAEWLWISGGFEDGTAFNHLSFWLADYPEQRMVNGFWYDGEETHPLTDAEVNEKPSFSAETTRGWMHEGTPPEIELALEWDGGSTAVEVEPTATTPLDWVDEDRGQRAVLNRSVSRQKRETGAEGAGFLENMCQLDIDGEG